MAFLRCMQIHSVFLIQYGQLQVDFKLFVCSIYLYKLDISAVSAVFEVTTNAVCRGRRAVYQGICDTTSKLAKLGNIKKTRMKHLWLIRPARGGELNRKGNSRREANRIHKMFIDVDIWCYIHSAEAVVLLIYDLNLLHTLCPHSVMQSKW